MAKFEVGEVAIITGAAHPFTHLIGCEVEITSHPSIVSEYGVGYTGIANGRNPHPDYFEEAALRKKKPPEELSSWEEVQKLTNWNPVKEVEHG